MNKETKEKEEEYNTALMSYTSKYIKSSDALRSNSSESAYRDSTKRLKEAYAQYAECMKVEGNPLPRWV